MLLDVEPDCFHVGADLRLVLDLLHLVQSERHEWQPPPATALAADEYFEVRLGKGKQDLAEYQLVKKYLKDSVYPKSQVGASPVQVTVEHLKDLVHDLGQPVIVVVENRLNDGQCVLFQARLLGRDRIVRAEREGWIDFDHSGGSGQLPDLGADRRRRYRRLVRIVLVIDGDVCYPGEVSPHRGRLGRLSDDGIRVFIWPGRELENFLPVRVLVDGRGKRAQRWAQAVRALTWPQRAHLDMKQGIPRVPKPRQAAEETAFHEAIPAEYRAVLTGQGYKIPPYEKMRVRSAGDEDLADLPAEAQAAIHDLLDLIESVL